jgi:hypothetical protein
VRPVPFATEHTEITEKTVIRGFMHEELNAHSTSRVLPSPSIAFAMEREGQPLPVGGRFAMRKQAFNVSETTVPFFVFSVFSVFSVSSVAESFKVYGCT